jgi:hypothetical protein
MNSKAQLRIKSGVLDPVSAGTAELVRSECKQMKEVPCKLVATKHGVLLCKVEVSWFYL